MHAIYTTDDAGRVVGVMSLRELLAAPAGAKISEIAWTEVQSVRPAADREEVARVIANYDLVAVPVVSESGHIMGVITVDDVIDAIQEEQTEDVQKLGGMEALDEPYSHDLLLAHDQEARGLVERAVSGRDADRDGARRVPVGDRQEDGRRAVPTVDHQLGRQLGFAGDVALIRALALREVELARLVARRRSRARRLASRSGRSSRSSASRASSSGRRWPTRAGTSSAIEIGHNYDVSQVNGVMQMIAGQHHLLAATVALSLLGVVMFGTLVGSMLPFMFRGMGFDPASASAPFIATFVDVTGLIIYFNVALHILLR